MNPAEYIFPVGSNVLLKTETYTKVGQLFIPEEAREQFYVVAAAGPEAELDVGTRVVPDVRHLKPVTVEGTKFNVTDAKELLLVVKNPTSTKK